MTATTEHLYQERAAAAHRRRLGFALDLDGTVYLGERLLPGAAELVAALAERGSPCVFATNNSSVTGAAYQQRLVDFGIAVERSSIVTSNDVAQHHLLETGISRAYLLATPEVRAEYAERGLRHDPLDPEAVVVTFDTTLDYAKLRDAVGWILAGRPFFATHPDLVCPTPTGPIPDCGSFIALLESATGRSPQVLGKPNVAMANTIAARLDQPAATIAFVGDRLYTDVRMANENGFFAVLTLTGEATVADLSASPHRPDRVVADLVQLLAELDAIEELVLATSA